MVNGAFTGNGSGITNLSAAQLTTGTLPLAQLPNAVVTNNQSGVILNGTFSGDGSGLTNLNASQLNSNVVTTATDPIGASFILTVTSLIRNGYSLNVQHANNVASNSINLSSDLSLWVTNWFATPFTDNLYGVNFVYENGPIGNVITVTNKANNYLAFYLGNRTNPTGMVYVAVFR